MPADPADAEVDGRPGGDQPGTVLAPDHAGAAAAGDDTALDAPAPNDDGVEGGSADATEGGGGAPRKLKFFGRPSFGGAVFALIAWILFFGRVVVYVTIIEVLEAERTLSYSVA